MLALLALNATLQLTAKDNNHAYTVKPQMQIVVALPANPVTGYRWWYDPQSLGGSAHVRLLSHRYVLPATGRPEARGKEIRRFRAVGHGRVGLWLRYVRGRRWIHGTRSFAATTRVR